MQNSQKRKDKIKKIINHVPFMTEQEYQLLLTLLAEYCFVDRKETVNLVIGHI